MEYRPDYGREVFTGIAKIDGFPVAFIGNRQGVFPGYPEYAQGAYPGVGGKHYREGLIKQAEFVTLCGRDNLPIVWLQDTTGIDVGDARRGGGAARPGTVAGLFHRADRASDDVHRAAQGLGRRPLHHGAVPRPTTTTPSPWALR